MYIAQSTYLHPHSNVIYFFQLLLNLLKTARAKVDEMLHHHHGSGARVLAPLYDFQKMVSLKMFSTGGFRSAKYVLKTCFCSSVFYCFVKIWKKVRGWNSPRPRYHQIVHDTHREEHQEVLRFLRTNPRGAVDTKIYEIDAIYYKFFNEKRFTRGYSFSIGPPKK